MLINRNGHKELLFQASAWNSKFKSVVSCEGGPSGHLDQELEPDVVKIGRSFTNNLN